MDIWLNFRTIDGHEEEQTFPSVKDAKAAITSKLDPKLTYVNPFDRVADEIWEVEVRGCTPQEVLPY